METIIIAIFIIGYILIALEHPIKINKTATALLTGVLCWTLFILSEPTESLLSSIHYNAFASDEHNSSAQANSGSQHIFHGFVIEELGRHLGSISQILFFLLGAMTIVELIDGYHGFRFITDRIKTRDPKVLLWVVCWITFFLSSILDNLTTTIVMVSLIRKLIPEKQLRFLFIGMIVTAANAGGAWTPIGDVTTTMLWIGGQVSTFGIMKSLFLPSVACLLVPLIILSFRIQQATFAPESSSDTGNEHVVKGGGLMLFAGISVLLAVPVFKTFTHLPPYVGMLGGLGIVWIISELINPDMDESIRKNYTAAGALSRVDVPSILFFLGILLAVGALESMNSLHTFSAMLNEQIGDSRIIITLTGILSAIIDNVPLVAASMGMYSLEQFPQDHFIWEYLAYCAGTGGSILIIGSAAGVAAMGMEKIDFIWYLKKISLLAFLGYASGAVVYLLWH